MGAREVALVVGGGVYGACPVSGGSPVTFAGGGNFSTGSPAMSRSITADQVAVGYPAPKYPAAPLYGGSQSFSALSPSPRTYITAVASCGV